MTRATTVEIWRDARRQYEDGTARVVDLARTLGVTHQAVTRRRRVEGWVHPSDRDTTVVVTSTEEPDEPNLLVIYGESVRVITRLHASGRPTYHAEIMVRHDLGYVWHPVPCEWWAMPTDDHRVGPFDDLNEALAALVQQDADTTDAQSEGPDV